MKRLIAFLLLANTPNICFGDDFDAALAKELALGNDYAYQVVEHKFLDVSILREICKKIYYVAQRRNWPAVKIYRQDSNNCGELDLKRACEEADEDGLRYFVLASSNYYYHLYNDNKDICEEQVVPCEQVLSNMVKADIKASIRISGYSYSKIPKEIDVQCSEIDGYCVANWPCVDSLRSGENCYSCKKVFKKSETCNPISVYLTEVKRGNSKKSKHLTDFDKDCTPLF